MLDLKTILVVIILWGLVVVTIYAITDPTTPSPDQPNKIKLFMSLILIAGFVLFVLAYYLNQSPTSEVRKIPVFEALSHLTQAEKTKFNIKSVNDLEILELIPHQGGKEYTMKYIIQDGDYIGRIAYLTFNCMSDFKNSSSDISSDSRFRGFIVTPIDRTTARRLLHSESTTPLDKLIKASNEVKRIYKRGGESATELVGDLVDEEEKRYEGEQE